MKIREKSEGIQKDTLYVEKKGEGTDSIVREVSRGAIPSKRKKEASVEGKKGRVW